VARRRGRGAGMAVKSPISGFGRGGRDVEGTNHLQPKKKVCGAFFLHSSSSIFQVIGREAALTTRSIKKRTIPLFSRQFAD